MGLGQKMTADDNRHTARDFAHRLKQRQVMVARDCFIGDGGDARFQQRIGELAVGGEMKIGEKCSALVLKEEIHSRPVP